MKVKVTTGIIHIGVTVSYHKLYKLKNMIVLPKDGKFMATALHTINFKAVI